MIYNDNMTFKQALNILQTKIGPIVKKDQDGGNILVEVDPGENFSRQLMQYSDELKQFKTINSVNRIIPTSKLIMMNMAVKNRKFMKIPLKNFLQSQASIDSSKIDRNSSGSAERPKVISNIRSHKLIFKNSENSRNPSLGSKTNSVYTGWSTNKRLEENQKRYNMKSQLNNT